jgi:hypothetical protein
MLHHWLISSRCFKGIWCPQVTNTASSHTGTESATTLPWVPERFCLKRHVTYRENSSVCDATLGTKMKGIFDKPSNYHIQWITDTFMMVNLEKVLAVLQSQFWDQLKWSKCSLLRQSFPLQKHKHYKFQLVLT